MPNNNQPIPSILEDANRLLEGMEKSPFSDNAFEKLNTQIKNYIGALVYESIRISERHKSDLVSSHHVELANESLIAKRKGKLTYIAGTIGGLLLGTAVSNIFGMLVLNSVFTTSGIVLTVVVGIIGSFLIALPLNNE